MLLTQPALAQRADRTDRGDLSESRRATRPPQRTPAPSPLPREQLFAALLAEEGEEEPAKPSWAFNVGSPVLLDVNPAGAPGGSADALYGDPSFSAEYSRPGIFPRWDLTVSGAADADLYSYDPDELDETRLDGGVILSRDFAGVGKFSLGFKERVVFSGAGFETFNYALQRYVMSFKPKISDNFSLALTGEFRTSTQSKQRRWFADLNMKWTALATKDGTLTFAQQFSLSEFRKGGNSGREDLLSQTKVTFVPELSLPDGFTFDISATLIRRFSNRADNRFTDVQVGPSFSYDF
ncbi:hypothetical protein ACCC88_04910 [Sphingomonas sp. Sphisp140]|uniref:hypothetical protein n=1 Tax=unclassified Sphingomonas TaxID=196159 RepID=UPI0039AF7F76